MVAIAHQDLQDVTWKFAGGTTSSVAYRHSEDGAQKCGRRSVQHLDDFPKHLGRA